MQDANGSPATPKGPGQSGLRQFAGKFCVSITLVVGFLAAGECIFYFLLPPATASPTDYKSYVIWQVARPALKVVTVDAEGLRRTYYSHCEADAYTIWMFGGSGMWGEAIRDWETIPSQVAKHYENSGRRVCVKNYGEEGWGSTQEVIKLMLELKRAEKKPDAVIFYDGTLDSFLPYESDEVDVHWSFPLFKKKFESWRVGEQRGIEYFRNTNTYLGLQWVAGKLRLADDTVGPRFISAEQAAPMAKRTLDNYSKNMDMVDSLAARYGFHYVCLWEPYLLFTQKPLSSAEKSLRDKEEKNNPGMVQVSRSSYELFSTVKRPHFVYLGDIFKDHGETLFLARGHLNPEGSQIAAERISQILEHLGP